VSPFIFGADVSNRMNSRPVPRPTTARAYHSLTGGVQRVAFWAGVVLPLAYVPLLSSSIAQTELSTLGALIAVHVLCLVAGHDHSP
jgi:hypothetical protein